MNVMNACFSFYKRDKVTWEWRKIHNEELNDVYSSPDNSGDQIENEMGGACSRCMVEQRCIHGLGGKT